MRRKLTQNSTRFINFKNHGLSKMPQLSATGVLGSYVLLCFNHSIPKYSLFHFCVANVPITRAEGCHKDSAKVKFFIIEKFQKNS